MEILGELSEELEEKVMSCGDFNSHSTLWGNCHADNGMIIEELTEDKNLLCRNNGRRTRFNARTGTESAIDLTLVSDSFMKHPCVFRHSATSCKFETLHESH